MNLTTLIGIFFFFGFICAKAISSWSENLRDLFSGFSSFFFGFLVSLSIVWIVSKLIEEILCCSTVVSGYDGNSGLYRTHSRGGGNGKLPPLERNSAPRSIKPTFRNQSSVSFRTHSIF